MPPFSNRAVLFIRAVFALCVKHLKRADDVFSCVGIADNRIDITVSRCRRDILLKIRISSCRLFESRRICAVAHDLCRHLRIHHTDFGIRPCKYHVRPDSFGTHEDIRAAIGLACDHGNLRNRGIDISADQSRTGIRKNAFRFHIILECLGIGQGEHRNIEGIAETDEAGCFANPLRLQ